MKSSVLNVPTLFLHQLYWLLAIFFPWKSMKMPKSTKMYSSQEWGGYQVKIDLMAILNYHFTALASNP
jgi:hypothetical protein